MKHSSEKRTVELVEDVATVKPFCLSRAELAVFYVAQSLSDANGQDIRSGRTWGFQGHRPRTLEEQRRSFNCLNYYLLFPFLFKNKIKWKRYQM